MILADADFYIGLYVETDVHYLRAKKVLEEVTDDEEVVVTSWDVVSEVTTKLSYFVSKEVALKFLRGIVDSGTEIMFVNNERRVRVGEVFRKQKSKRVSVTDCVNMAIAKELGIKKFLSFDKHYEQNGFELW
jgi:predicted nucleic acid-binding protein